MAIFRRTDLGGRRRESRLLRQLIQSSRDGGGDPGATGLWGNIGGDIDTQSDLKIKRDDLEALALLMDD